MRLAERLELVAQLLEGLPLQRVDAALPEGMHRDQARVLQGLEVLGHLRLAEPELGGDLADRTRRLVEQLDDPQAVVFGKCCQDGVIHETKVSSAMYILFKEYL